MKWKLKGNTVGPRFNGLIAIKVGFHCTSELETEQGHIKIERKQTIS